MEVNNMELKKKLYGILLSLCITTGLINVSANIGVDPDYPDLLVNDVQELNYSSTIMQKICVKQKPDDPKNSSKFVKIEATSFKDLVQNSDIYVDKSLFIRSIIMSEDRLLSFTYPKKWGKSINLDMVKTFLEIEMDSEGKPLPIHSTWSYKYFQHGQIMLPDGKSEMLERPPYIYRHKNHIEKFLGKYPVINLDLSTSQPTKEGEDGFYEAFRKAIGAVFERHDYLAKNLTDAERKETFEAYKNAETCGMQGMINSLRFLSQLLFDYFKQRVFIFIDGYDYMIEQAFFAVPSKIGLEGAEKFLDFYSTFLHNTFVENKDYLRTGILSGVFNIDQCFEKFGSQKIVNYNVLNNNLEPFQGFTMEEVEQLYHRLDIPAVEIKEVFDRYGEYYLRDHPEVNIFNPQFIVNFINTRKFANFFANTSMLQIFQQTLRLEETKKFLQAVISRSVNTEIERRNLNLNKGDLLFLNCVASAQLCLSSNSTSAMFVLFYAAGYLSLDVKSKHFLSTKVIPTLIPCKEIESMIVEELKIYYRKKFGDKVCYSAQKVAKSLIFTLHSKYGHNPLLSKPLQNLYTRLSSSGYDDVDEAHFLVLLYAKSNFRYNIGFNVLYYDAKKKLQRIYMTLYSHNVGGFYKYLDAGFNDFTVGFQVSPELHHEFFFRNKHVRMIRFGVITRTRVQSSISMVIYNSYPLVWSETKKKFLSTKRWSYNFAALRDYHEGEDHESSQNGKALY